MPARYLVVETGRHANRYPAEDETAAQRFAAGLRAAHPDAQVRVEPIPDPRPDWLREVA